MAVTKHGLDFSDFQTEAQANKLRSDSIRKTYVYDKYAGKSSFIALVLTTPVPMTAGDASIEAGAPQPILPDESKEPISDESTTRKIGKYGFRARIMGPDSPHTFVPNPCGSREFTKSTLGDKFSSVRDKLVAMHTMFYTDKDFSLNPGDLLPSEGDYVEVFLSKGDHGFNLQKGLYKGTIVNKNDIKQTLSNLEIAYAKSDGSAQDAYKKDPIESGPLALEMLGKVAYPLEKGKAWYEGGPTGAQGVGKVNSNWGPPSSVRSGANLRTGRHGGTDMRCRPGEKVYAVADGTVIKAGWNAGLGREITVVHDENSYAADPTKSVYTRYAHLKSISVSSGKVKAGQVIGISGDSFIRKGKKTEGKARAQGGMDPHLHIELWVGGYGGSYGIPDGYADGPTKKFTIDFMVWLAEQQAKANMPGELIARTRLEGSEGPPASSVGVESDSQIGDLEEDLNALDDSEAAQTSRDRADVEADFEAQIEDMEAMGETRRITSDTYPS